MSTTKTKIGVFLKRSKIPIEIQDSETYKRVTIRINHNGVSLRDTEYGANIGTKKQFVLKSGQFILSKIDARYGAFGIVPEEVDNAIITGNFWAYDVDKSLVDINWFNQYIHSPDFYELCERASSGITHRKYLDENFFLNYEIDLPNIDSQRIQIQSIGHQKNDLKEFSTELASQLAYLKELRQAFLREAMQGKLVPQIPEEGKASDLLAQIQAEKARLIKDKKLKKENPFPAIKSEEIPFEIPENWVWCRLGEVAYIASGSTPKPDGFTEDGVPFFKMYNIKQQKIDFYHKPQYIKRQIHEGALKRSQAHSGDVLMNIVGPPLGKLAIIPTDFPESNFNQAIALIRPFEGVLNYWIYWYLNEMSEINSIDTKGVAGQNNISITQTNNMKIPLPPLSEQARIVGKLDALMALCDSMEASIRESQTVGEALLQQVLREALQA